MITSTRRNSGVKPNINLNEKFTCSCGVVDILKYSAQRIDDSNYAITKNSPKVCFACAGIETETEMVSRIHHRVNILLTQVKLRSSFEDAFGETIAEKVAMNKALRGVAYEFPQKKRKGLSLKECNKLILEAKTLLDGLSKKLKAA